MDSVHRTTTCLTRAEKQQFEEKKQKKRNVRNLSKSKGRQHQNHTQKTNDVSLATDEQHTVSRSDEESESKKPHHFGITLYFWLNTAVLLIGTI